ncbi:hypothetical protein LT85_2591 [Collimonas arenae]|uniref:Uncharacterized protein n=1 Tax=Collimonas arenae TaxID=279058 RepID=A0A0A1FDQ9_9BURK|nr:hypothetical protein LT85_2591 [Collimonas arenae]
MVLREVMVKFADRLYFLCYVLMTAKESEQKATLHSKTNH